MRRTMRMARLVERSARGPIDVIPPLVDAAIVSIVGNRMRVSGIERHELLRA
jgi:hypothetical protein